MKRALIVLIALSAAFVSPAPAARVAGAAHFAYAAVVPMPAGTTATVSCPEPAAAVDAFFAGATVTNAEGPKAGAVNAATIGAYAARGRSLHVMARNGGSSTSFTGNLTLPLAQDPVAFEQDLAAAWPSLLRVAFASWSGDYACAVTIDGAPVLVEPADPQAAVARTAFEFPSGAGVDTPAANVSSEQQLSTAYSGYLFGILLCATGSSSAEGPEGQSFVREGSVAGTQFPIFFALPTDGVWRFTRSACADTFAPVLWTFLIA